MHILISFNNTYQSPGFPVLGLINAETRQLEIPELPEEIPDTGTLGLAQSSKYIFVGLQYAFDARKANRIPPEIGLQYGPNGILASLQPCSLLVFSRKNFKLLHQYEFRLVKDVHSFLLSPDESRLYVVSTGTDELIELDLDGCHVKNEKTVWRPEVDGELNDHHHLNSICYWNGDIIISGFGKKAIPDDWNSAKNGFIYNVTKKRLLKEGLLQPHSLAPFNGTVAF